MYVPMVAALMLILPLASVLAQLLSGAHGAPHAAEIMPVIAKWYVFWAMGVRLFLAGLRQTLQPAYTAQTILGLKGTECLLLVRELGFANLAMGSVGLASLAVPAWVIPAAMLGGIYYGLAGINHIRQKHRNKLETAALVSDLFASYVLIACCVAAVLSGTSGGRL
jgi:hypothetical protein